MGDMMELKLLILNDKLIDFLLRIIVLAEITPTSSIFFILFQHGVGDTPTLLEISDKGNPAFFLNDV